MLPHSRCNFITEDQLIMVGAKPIDNTICDILSVGVTMVVNLEKKRDYELPDHVTYIHLPTNPGSAPSLLKCKKVAEQVMQAHKDGRKIYIHCSGGHGRAGAFGAYLLGRMSNGSMDAADAIRRIEIARETRQDTSRNFIPTPETNAQVKFLVDNLGLRAGHARPDRSDVRWLQRVKGDRAHRDSTRNRK